MNVLNKCNHSTQFLIKNYLINYNPLSLGVFNDSKPEKNAKIVTLSAKSEKIASF